MLRKDCPVFAGEGWRLSQAVICRCFGEIHAFLRTEGTQALARWFSWMIILLAVSACSPWPGWGFGSSQASYAAAAGDVDGDGDLDVLLGNGASEGMAPDTLWINQGGAQGNSAGKFRASAQRLTALNTRSVALCDLDGDGDLDGLATADGSLQVYFNQGERQAGPSGELFTGGNGIGLADVPGIWRAALGDLDADGDLDVVVANCCGGIRSGAEGQTWLPPYNLVFFNTGAGNFRDSGQRLGQEGTEGLALGDLDGDGDLDLYAANANALVDVAGNQDRNQPDRVWLNDGRGVFSDSGQRLGVSASTAVALGDLDGDGDLDAFVGGRGPALVWRNDGAGFFSAGGQRLGRLPAHDVYLGDLDGDGDLDALIAGEDQAELWLNDGAANFQLSGQQLELPERHALALGDLDGDGDLDLFAGYLASRYRVWWNDGFGRLGNSWR